MSRMLMMIRNFIKLLISILCLSLALVSSQEGNHDQHNDEKARKMARNLLFAMSCKGGQFYSSLANNCSDCPQFSSSPIGSTNIRNCSCNAGYIGSFNFAGSLNCSACAIGKYQTGTGMTSQANCNVCSSGTYVSSNGASLCSPCSQGSFQTGIGMTSCVLCQKGFYQSASRSIQCTLCSSGSYQSASGASFCSSCPKGSTSAAGSSSFSNCTCGAGFSGIVSSVSVICYGCAAGKYKDIIGTSSCVDCPTSSTSSAASISRANCSCFPGYFRNALQGCSPCSPGTLSQFSGSTSCSSCANHSWSGYASSSCTCNSGYIVSSSTGSCAECSAGTYKVSESECFQCPAGKYSSSLMDSISNCQPCRPGAYSIVVGASSNSVCTPCGAGKYSSVAAASSEGTCSYCSPGKYQGGFGANRESNCSSCPPGTFSTALGATAVQSCEACSAGSYSAGGSSLCSTCPNNTFATPGASVCSPCPRDALSGSGSGAASECRCRPGFVSYNGGRSCVACPPGLSSGSSNSFCFRRLGIGSKGSADGVWWSATFSYPSGVVAIDSANTIVSEYGSHILRRIQLGSAVAEIETISGAVNRPGWKDGDATAARFNHPMGLSLGRSQTEVLVADGFNHRIRKLDLSTMVVSTIAGSGFAGAADGPANSSRFNFPSALAVQNHVVYIADMYNNNVRRLELLTMQVSTLVNGFSYPMGIGLIPNTAFIAISDQLNQRVLLLNKTSGQTPSSDYSSCGTQDKFLFEYVGFSFPKGLCSMQGLVYVADSDNNAVSILEMGLGTVRMLDIIGLNQPSGLSCSEEQGRIWLCNTMGNQVLEILPPTCEQGYIGSDCRVCEAGKALINGSACLSCAPGSYSPVAGSSACSKCDSGKFSSLCGGSFCMSCEAGKYLSGTGISKDGLCSNCESGKYQPTPATAACLLCTSGTYASTSGMSYCNLCSAGTYSTGTGISSASNCTLCGAGTYQTGLGMLNSRNCTSCISGKFQSGLGATLSTACV